jgi:hypothetical protein
MTSSYKAVNRPPHLSRACQNKTSADVMAITKWTISTLRKTLRAWVGLFFQKKAPSMLGFSRRELVFACRVLALDPVARAPGAIRRVLALRYNAFEAHLASMGEHGRPVGFDVLVERCGPALPSWRR